MREAADGEARPKTPFVGSWGPETEAAVRATRSVLKAIAAVEQRKRARRGSVRADFEAAVVAILCEAAVDRLERGGQGFRCPRAMRQLEQRDRYRAKALNPQLPVALDRLAELGFIRQDKGYVDAGTGKRWQTAVWPGPELEALCVEYELSRDDFRDERPGDEIVLRSAREHDGHMVRVPYADTTATKVMRRGMQFINEVLRSARIEVIAERVPLFTDPTKRKLRRMFKLRPGQRVVDAFEEGGRLSGGFWLDAGFDGEARRNGILVDGHPLAEIDFGQSSLRVLYGIKGAADRIPDDGDLYSGIASRSGDHARDAVKSFIGALMNIAADDWATLAKLTGFAETILGRAFDDDSHALRGAISAVHRKHPAIADYLPSEIGRRVQKVEADILVQSLWRLGHRGIVGLGVHDAILVRSDRMTEAAEIMCKAFQDVCGAPASVSFGLASGAVAA